MEAYKTYLATLYELASKYYEEDLADFEMTPKIGEALKTYDEWVNFEDERVRHSSRAILEYEGEY